MPGSDRTTEAPRPPLTYRVTPRQWLAVDVVTAVLTMAVMMFGLRLLHAPRFALPTTGVAIASVAATLPVAVRSRRPAGARSTNCGARCACCAATTNRPRRVRARLGRNPLWRPRPASRTWTAWRRWCATRGPRSGST
ncbi:MAG TPA: hypothetical protein VHN16_02930 [Streptosporangiaceae bacterium]|nr:hypothetical protein [Streptosporangiaceae bacterium]